MNGILKPHISLNVSNLEASVAFYAKFFHTLPLKRRPGYAKFDLHEPALNLALVETAPTGVNVNHFGVQVASSKDVEAARQRLEKVGLLDLVETGTTCCFAKQDKVWAVDPDGNRWEIFTVLADAEVMKEVGGACCTTPAEVPSSCSTPVACASTPEAQGACGCGA
ncbi:MAG TPA: ArsI/CadI family heavy metal resistance metalloenzyme [Holophagaceae bacterium]|nr:ArsI/CadI family heavy metal resistance metalloenzyme [Holophagaceae bacterium]